MTDGSSPVTRRIGMTLFLAFLGLVVVGLFVRDPWNNDLRFFLARWPVWMVGVVLLPLLALRILWQRAWWRRRRERRRARHAAGHGKGGPPAA